MNGNHDIQMYVNELLEQQHQVNQQIEEKKNKERNVIMFFASIVATFTGYFCLKYAFYVPEEAPISEGVWRLCTVIFIICIVVFAKTFGAKYLKKEGTL